jgi:hypothetical protein
MKIWVIGGIAPSFLISALGEGEWSALRPGRFTPGEIAPSTRLIGDLVRPRADIDACLYPELNPSCRPVAPRYADSSNWLVWVSTIWLVWVCERPYLEAVSWYLQRHRCTVSGGKKAHVKATAPDSIVKKGPNALKAALDEVIQILNL